MNLSAVKRLFTREGAKVALMAAPTLVTKGTDPSAPVRFLPANTFPDSIIPEKYREVVDLSDGGAPEGVTLNRPLGNNCVLIRDTRYKDVDQTIIINPSKRRFRASNVTIEVAKIKGKLFFQVIGGNSKVSIGYCRGLNGHFDMGLDSIVTVGDNTSAGHMRVMAARGKMTVGEDCMISGQVVFNAGIHHAIIDLNEDAAKMAEQKMSMTVGDHVWICQQAYLVGRANVGSGSIVGARAVVAGDTPENCLVAGNPAAVKKRNITWARPPNEIDEVSQRYIDGLYA